MPATLPSQFTPLLGDGHTETRGKRVILNQFGDGYLQRIDDTINTTDRRMTLRFFTDARSAASPAILQAFLDARGLSDAISWQAPTDSSPQNWLITKPYERQDFLLDPVTQNPVLSVFTIQVMWVPF